MDERLNRFNRVAGMYDVLVAITFGDRLIKAQCEFLSEIREGSKVLVIGGGTGKFLGRLIKASPTSQITYVEASSRMIDLSRHTVQRAGPKGNVIFIHGTEDNIPGDRYDVIILHFFLDMFDAHRQNLIARAVEGRLCADGMLLAADFVNTGKVLHRLLLKVMYAFFNLAGAVSQASLCPWDLALTRAGLRVAQERRYLNGFVTSTLWRKSANG